MSDPTPTLSSAPRRRSGINRRRALAGLVLGAMLAVSGACSSGVPTLRSATPTAPTLPDPVVMARAATGTPPIEETAAFWQARVDRDPRDLPSRRLLASSLMTKAAESGDLTVYEQAEAHYRAATELSPDDPQSLLGLGSARAAQHDFATTAAIAARVLERDPSSVPARVSLGDAQFELGRYADARRTYALLARRVPNTATVFSRQARVAALDGQPARAVGLVRRALVDVGDLDQRPSAAAFFWFQLATYELNAGRLGDAARHVSQGLRVDPDHLPSRELLARVRVEQGQLSDARRRYTALVAITPAADLFGALAKVERALGDEAEARRSLDQGLAVGREQLGRFAAERRHLAAFFADADPAVALTAARTDYAARQDVQSAGGLAWAEYRTGQVARAVRHSREALRFGTKDAVLQAQGGLIEAEAGHETRAITLLRHALTVRPDYDVDWAPRARATLRRLEAGAR